MGPAAPRPTWPPWTFYGKEFYRGLPDDESEDCLYLNIWTPASATAQSRLPVLFWIHGGAFLHGCGSEKEFDGEGFAKKGVILVTINYRVNAFGFFAHPALEEETEEGRLRQLRHFRPDFRLGLGPAEHRRLWGATRTPSPWRGSPPAA